MMVKYRVTISSASSCDGTACTSTWFACGSPLAWGNAIEVGHDTLIKVLSPRLPWSGVSLRTQGGKVWLIRARAREMCRINIIFDEGPIACQHRIRLCWFSKGNYQRTSKFRPLQTRPNPCRQYPQRLRRLPRRRPRIPCPHCFRSHYCAWFVAQFPAGGSPDAQPNRAISPVHSGDPRPKKDICVA